MILPRSHLKKVAEYYKSTARGSLTEEQYDFAMGKYREFMEAYRENKPVLISTQKKEQHKKKKGKEK